MKEPKTQEEFEQKVQKLTERLNDEFSYDRDEIIKLWLEIEEFAYFYNNCYGPYYTKVFFMPKDKNKLKTIARCVSSSTFTKFFHLIKDVSLEEEFIYQCGEVCAWKKKALFATEPLEVIKSYFMGQDIQKTVEHSWDGEEFGINSYLLMNPRKEVVEWALENNEALGIEPYEFEMGLDHQVIPEINSLIKRKINHL